MTSGGSIGASEARATLAFAADLAACRRPSDLETALLGLPGLTGAECLGTGELRRPGGGGAIGVLPQIAHPYVFDAEALADWAVHWRQHPVVRRQLAGPEARVLSYTDFLTAREWRRLGIYSAYRHLELRGELSLQLAWDSRRIACLTVHRVDRPFGERERTLLETLAPHLRAAHARLELNHQAERWRAALECGLEEAGTCVVMIDAHDRIVGTDAGADRVLRRWFGTRPRPGALPVELAEWVERTRSAPRAPRFVRVAPGRRLDVLLTSVAGEERLLMLRERRTDPPDPADLIEALPVTRRQADVLALLGEGRSDAEIAQRLRISVRTVGHHVERILERLEVSNRTAAAALVHGELRRRG